MFVPPIGSSLLLSCCLFLRDVIHPFFPLGGRPCCDISTHKLRYSLVLSSLVLSTSPSWCCSLRSLVRTVRAPEADPGLCCTNRTDRHVRSRSTNGGPAAAWNGETQHELLGVAAVSSFLEAPPTVLCIFCFCFCFILSRGLVVLSFPLSDSSLSIYLSLGFVWIFSPFRAVAFRA